MPDMPEPDQWVTRKTLPPDHVLEAREKEAADESWWQRLLRDLS